LAQATFFKAIECWQNDNPLAAATLAPAAAWNLYHGIMGAASLYYLNQGVHRQMPYSSALREWSENLRRGYFAFQFEQNAQKHFWEREARYRQREAERRRRADEDFLRRIDADFLWSPEGRMKAANRPGPTDEEVEQEEAAAVSGGMANAA
jgi:hypothetical protein